MINFKIIVGTILLISLSSCIKFEHGEVFKQEKTGYDGVVAGGSSEINFVDHIQPIFAKSCKGCHQWQRYSNSFPKRDMIYNKVLTDEMPLSGDKLTEKEKELIADWIAGGAIEFPTDVDGPTDPSVPDEPTTPPIPQVSKGEKLFKTKCIACHETKSGKIPLLNGQTESYIVQELNFFKKGHRKDDVLFVMNKVAEALTDEDINSVADYLVKQDRCKIRTTGSLGDGDFDKGKVIAKRCIGCHGVDPNNFMKAPILYGQNRDYLFENFKKFRESKRPARRMIGMIGKDKTDEDLLNLATFFSKTSKCDK